MAFVTELTWLKNGEIASELVLNRPLEQLLENDETLQNLKVNGANESIVNTLPLFSDTTGKSLKPSSVIVTNEGSILLPEGQNITVNGKPITGGSGTRYTRWLGT